MPLRAGLRAESVRTTTGRRHVTVAETRRNRPKALYGILDHRFIRRCEKRVLLVKAVDSKRFREQNDVAVRQKDGDRETSNSRNI